MKFTTLKSGLKIPMLGNGTDGFSGVDEAEKAITDAIGQGYRLIDAATGYGTHPAVAKAVAKVNREDVFICSKFHNGDLAESGSVVNVIEKLLRELNVDYLDLLLIHNPKVDDFPTVFKALIGLKKAGLFKSIGVSNFSEKHLQRLGNDIKHVDVNQVECHPYLNQKPLKKYCDTDKVELMAYRPLAQGKLLHDKLLQELATRYHKSVPQIILRWLVQRDIVAIVKASNIEHMAQNLAIFDFELSADDIELINDLHSGLRTCTGTWADFDDE